MIQRPVCTANTSLASAEAVASETLVPTHAAANTLGSRLRLSEVCRTEQTAPSQNGDDDNVHTWPDNVRSVDLRIIRDLRERQRDASLTTAKSNMSVWALYSTDLITKVRAVTFAK